MLRVIIRGAFNKYRTNVSKGELEKIIIIFSDNSGIIFLISPYVVGAH